MSYQKKLSFSRIDASKVLAPLKDSFFNKETVRIPKFNQTKKLNFLSTPKSSLFSLNLTPKPSNLNSRKSEHLHKLHLFKTYQAAKLIKKLPSDLNDYQFKKVFIPRKAGFEHCKTVVLDLDETLVHASLKPLSIESFEISLRLPDTETRLVWVNIRPFAKEFLREVSKNFEVIIFTASCPAYADSILDRLDPDHNYIHWRLYRENCVKINDIYLKDLRILEGRDLKDVVIVDNNAVSFAYQLNNGIPIVSWTDDSCDRELFNLGEYLNILKNTEDVREVNRGVFKMTSFYEDYIKEYLVGNYL